ncbi:hypothetical protein Tco_0867268 [Tanacetum coccineum]
MLEAVVLILSRKTQGDHIKGHCQTATLPAQQLILGRTKNLNIGISAVSKQQGGYVTSSSSSDDCREKVLKEHSVFVVTSKRSSLDKCKLPVGIRLFVSAAYTESDLQKAYESLKIVATLVLTGQN